MDGIAGPASDGNAVLEACEEVGVQPAWRNLNGAPQSFSGTASTTRSAPRATSASASPGSNASARSRAAGGASPV